MKKKQLVILIIVIIILAICGVYVYIKNNQNAENPVKTDPTSDKITVNNLKTELGATGNDDIYTVADEQDGRKILAIKPEIKYKIALVGVINKEQAPNLETLNSQINNAPKENGLWIAQEAREKFVEMLKTVSDGTYNVDEKGYLKIEQEGSTDYDKQIEELIDGSKKYIIDINSYMYIADEMTGEIMQDQFEDMDPYQTYTYAQDGDNMVIVLSTNKAEKLTNQEIITSFLELCK